LKEIRPQKKDKISPGQKKLRIKAHLALQEISQHPK
jgi:hypothetical protein